MVRSVFVAVVSFALIFGLYLFCDGACRRASEVLIRDCREVEERIRLGKKEEALMLLEDMETQWAQKADYFSFFVDHQRTELIREYLRTVRIALEQGEEFELHKGLSLLREASESLYEAEAFMLKNIC